MTSSRISMMSDTREQMRRIERALKAAQSAAGLIEQALAHASGHEQPIRLRIASQDIGAVITMLRAAETAQEARL
jgi:hypothetical protein